MINVSQPISVIICAYNEAKNIGRVLKVLYEISWLDEIIVIDDCSSDSTASQVAKFPKVRLVSHQQNQGKGGAVATGMENTQNELILFLDADLIGLTEQHLKKLIAPVLFTQEADMTLGVFGKGDISSTNIANRMIPAISGQRVVWRKYLPQATELRDKKYGVDIFITHHVDESRIMVVELDGLSQVTKEDKSDNIFEALMKRLKMYKDIYKTLREDKRSEKK